MECVGYRRKQLCSFLKEKKNPKTKILQEKQENKDLKETHKPNTIKEDHNSRRNNLMNKKGGLWWVDWNPLGEYKKRNKNLVSQKVEN